MIAERRRRMKWWHEAKFGMFIHWGLYSILGRHEWVMEMEGIPAQEYEKLAAQFKPKPNFAREWARLAKRTGQKYMVMTTKHHEGFCHFDTKTDRLLRTKTGRRTRSGAESMSKPPEPRAARRLLLFADGLASSGRCPVLNDEAARRRFVDYIHAHITRVDDQLRQDRHSLVRRLVAARCEGLGIGEDEQDGLRLQPDIIVNNRNQAAGRFRDTRTTYRGSRSRARAGNRV